MKGRADLTAWVDGDALQLTPEGFERQGPVSGMPAARLSRHLFAIANLAFAKMLDAKQNQCIIIRCVRLGTFVSVGAGGGGDVREESQMTGLHQARPAVGAGLNHLASLPSGIPSGMGRPAHVLLCHRRSKKGKGRGA